MLSIPSFIQLCLQMDMIVLSVGLKIRTFLKIK